MSDINVVLSSARWSEDSYYLKEFVHKFKLPQLAKVVKGQYLSLGVSTLSSPSLQSTVLLCHAPPRPALVAQSVKFKDGKRVVGVGPKLAIPQTYEGFFEILSEDGRSVRCIEGVAELARRFPESVLVRDSIKAFVSRNDDIETIHDKSRIIQAGEVLILVGEVLGVKGKNQTRYLRCIDSEGENIYLGLEMKGRFSALAKEENISGVHNIKNLMKKRLPLMARIAHGAAPVGLRSPQMFLPELRILGKVEDGGIMALPLSKDSNIVYLPLPSIIKLQPVLNSQYISGMSEVKRLEDKVRTQLEAQWDSIVVYDIPLPKDIQKTPGRKSSLPQSDIKRSSVYGIMTSRSDSGRPDDYDEIDQIYDYVRGFAPLPKSAKGWHFIGEAVEDRKERSDERKDTVPVRDTESTPPEPPPIETIPSRRLSAALDLTPTPPTPNSTTWSSPVTSPNALLNGAVNAPIIMNLERPQSTDPRLFIKSAESKKRVRPKTADISSLKEDKTKSVYPPARYIKSANKQSSGKHKFFKVRSKDPPPPMGTSVQAKEVKSNLQPSFFNLRYKSLNNLSQQEYDTLDSSNSGGKTSFDSAGSRNIPEKRSRKLTRPRSLTNLVWDFRVQHTMLSRSNSKPSLLVPDKGRQESKGWQDGKVRRGREPSPGAIRRIGGSSVTSTLYL